MAPPSHLSGAYLAARGGFAAAHVLFRGAAQTIPAMLAGDVHFAVDNLASYVPVIREGRMRALAVAGGPGPSSRADHPETV